MTRTKMEAEDCASLPNQPSLSFSPAAIWTQLRRISEVPLSIISYKTIFQQMMCHFNRLVHLFSTRTEKQIHSSSDLLFPTLLLWFQFKRQNDRLEIPRLYIVEICLFLGVVVAKTNGSLPTIHLQVQQIAGVGKGLASSCPERQALKN